jgi:hypothetical protein
MTDMRKIGPEGFDRIKQYAYKIMDVLEDAPPEEHVYVLIMVSAATLRTISPDMKEAKLLLKDFMIGVEAEMAAMVPKETKQ